VAFFEAVGLSPTQAQILVNDRALMNEEFAALNIPVEARKEALRLIDRRDKMGAEEWNNYAQSIGLSQAQIIQLTALLGDSELWRKSERLARLFSATEALGIRPYVRYAPHVIRGLDYYNSTVFEAWDVAGEFRALFGGGRYANLVSAVGGEPLPAVGFAMGDVVINLLLKKFNLLPDSADLSPAPVLVTVFDENLLGESIRLASELRRSGLNVVCYPEAAKLARQFKYADRRGIKIAVVLGPDESMQGQVTVKDLRSGEQQTCQRGEAPGIIKKLLLEQAA
jgi:histidyl-tRNA synthetase